MWAVVKREVDQAFIARSRGKVLLDLGCGPLELRSVAASVQAARTIGVDMLPANQPDLVATVDRLGLCSESDEGRLPQRGQEAGRWQLGYCQTALEVHHTRVSQYAISTECAR